MGLHKTVAQILGLFPVWTVHQHALNSIPLGLNAGLCQFVETLLIAGERPLHIHPCDRFAHFYGIHRRPGETADLDIAEGAKGKVLLPYFRALSLDYVLVTIELGNVIARSPFDPLNRRLIPCLLPGTAHLLEHSLFFPRP